MQKHTEILPQQTFLFGEEELTSLQEGFHVNHTALQGKGSARRMNATSGLKCLEQYKRFNHATSWGKTFLGFLIGMEDWYSTKCKLTWKVKGTKYNRLYFQLAVSTPRIKEKEFGLLLLKTPTVMDGMVTSGKKNPVPGNSGTLQQEIMSGYAPTIRKLLLPTPQAMDIRTDVRKPSERTDAANKGGCSNLREYVVNNLVPTPKVGGAEKYETRANRQGHEKAMSHLESFVEYMMLPTPTANDCKNDPQTPSQGIRSNLAGAMIRNGITSQQLNPQFVAEMMGFPKNWTTLPFLNGETKV